VYYCLQYYGTVSVSEWRTWRDVVGVLQHNVDGGIHLEEVVPGPVLGRGGGREGEVPGHEGGGARVRLLQVVVPRLLLKTHNTHPRKQEEEYMNPIYGLHQISGCQGTPSIGCTGIQYRAYPIPWAKHSLYQENNTVLFSARLTPIPWASGTGGSSRRVLFSAQRTCPPPSAET